MCNIVERLREAVEDERVDTFGEMLLQLDFSVEDWDSVFQSVEESNDHHVNEAFFKVVDSNRERIRKVIVADKTQRLKLAVSTGDAKQVKELLHPGANIMPWDAPADANYHKDLPLEALRRKDFVIFEMLQYEILTHAQRYQKKEFYKTVLYAFAEAVNMRETDLMQYLVSSGLLISLDASSFGLLQYAATKDCKNLMEILTRYPGAPDYGVEDWSAAVAISMKRKDRRIYDLLMKTP